MMIRSRSNTQRRKSRAPVPGWQPGREVLSLLQQQVDGLGVAGKTMP